MIAACKALFATMMNGETKYLTTNDTIIQNNNDKLNYFVIRNKNSGT